MSAEWCGICKDKHCKAARVGRSVFYLNTGKVDESEINIPDCAIRIEYLKSEATILHSTQDRQDRNIENSRDPDPYSEFDPFNPGNDLAD